MVRYMIYMSYIGSRYRGAQRQSGSESLLDVDSIQGAIEAGLLTLYPRSLIRPKLTLSSRTDAGVHALCSTAHVELENPHEPFYETESTLKTLNRYLTHCGHEIRITSFFPIKDTFHVRFGAQSRTYVYRLMCPKSQHELKLPIAELGRTWNLSDTKFDIEKVKAATRLFMGRKNFETFSGKNRTGRELRYERSLNILKIEDGEPLMLMDPLSKNFHYWNIVCNARAFLYNQVRRIVGALAGIGFGSLTERDINIMLHVPSSQSWTATMPVAPPHGLYLKEVTYDRVELATSRIRH
ncbi:tRNA pseudouridine synthase-like 1 [Venturia canescens]|uniref:tRNA pseudouridine synthase-like 1 n=1 Tax=Venturia canescens TaxID=32260 RepID=UPI001C9BEF6D|nr:tRNA pseudouridine synthase-like 1 [Venturia canescens]